MEHEVGGANVLGGIAGGHGTLTRKEVLEQALSEGRDGAKIMTAKL